MTKPQKEIWQLEGFLPWATYLLVRVPQGRFLDKDGDPCNLLSINGNIAFNETRWSVCPTSTNHGDVAAIAHFGLTPRAK